MTKIKLEMDVVDAVVAAGSTLKAAEAEQKARNVRSAIRRYRVAAEMYEALHASGAPGTSDAAALARLCRLEAERCREGMT